MQMIKGVLERWGARQTAARAHRREMELKHGWRPSPWGEDKRPKQVSTSQHFTLAGGGFAVGMFFLAVAAVAAAAAFALAQSSPQEWVDAWLRLQEATATRDLTATR